MGPSNPLSEPQRMSSLTKTTPPDPAPVSNQEKRSSGTPSRRPIVRMRLLRRVAPTPNMLVWGLWFFWIAHVAWAQTPVQPEAGSASDWLSSFVSSHGLWLGLVAVFLGGLLLNFTPCVYPMIPVTIAFFTSQAAGALGRATQLACCYVIGMSLSYALLGVIAASTGALLGDWLQQPVVLIGV